MNTGLQDAFNLGWMLALVCRGQAGDGILDSYEAERRPVALDRRRMLDQSGQYMCWPPLMLSVEPVTKPPSSEQRKAITAAMRKFLIILNTMVKTKTVWNKARANAS